MTQDFLENSTLVFKGVRFDVRASEIILDSQKKVYREAVIHPGAVVILPVMSAEHILMIQNQRFAVGETLWELPAGILELYEAPLTTAHRELVEETGYTAKTMTPLTKFYTSPGFCNEMIYAYVAKELDFVGQHLEEGETISTALLPWKKVLEMIQTGEIRDAKTLTTLLFYSSLCKLTTKV